MPRKLILAVSLAIIVVLQGCARTLPVYNITDTAVITGSGNAATEAQVRNAIATAAQSKGWQVQQVEGGHMVATIVVRRHTAEIDINYSATDYSITYKDSDVLLYDGQKIHRNYNKWIKHLNDRIVRNLNAL